MTGLVALVARVSLLDGMRYEYDGEQKSGPTTPDTPA
jgi:hypothetical protein